MSVIKSYHTLGFPLFLIPNQKTDILSFLKKSFLPFLLTVPVFNEMCIAASKLSILRKKENTSNGLMQYDA